MKIIDIRKFVSTDRRVHVALAGSLAFKDGYLSLVKRDGKTFVSVKGDRGRPATIAPANIESIVWHTDPAKSKETCTTCGTTYSSSARHTEETCSNILAARKPKRRIVKKAESAKVAEKVLAGKKRLPAKSDADLPVTPVAHTVVLNWYVGTGQFRKEFVRAFTVVTPIKSDAIRTATQEVFRVFPRATSVKVNTGLTVTSVLLP